MDRALDDIAGTADEVATEQRAVARKLRAMKRQLDRGWSWRRVTDESGDVLGTLRESAKRLVGATGTLAATLAKGLAREGESRRGIAARLGVSHQRVSALLRNGRRS